jgi:methylase of polypeptide subunit release factors
VVPGLEGRLTPFYGVYTPTRTEYVELLLGVKGVRGASVIDVGTGTGLLAFVLLQRGAASVKATDLEPRAVECATLNAQQLGWGPRFSVEQRPLFPDAVAELIVCNPPWIPEAPKNRFDRAVFDEGDAFITGFLDGVGAHLTQQGRALLIISNLAELLGLRPRDWLKGRFEAAGLEVIATASVRAKHGKAKDPRDPLYAARSAEITTLYELRSRR